MDSKVKLDQQNMTFILHRKAGYKEFSLLLKHPNLNSLNQVLGNYRVLENSAKDDKYKELFVLNPEAARFHSLQYLESENCY